jgi:hypothetical protein
MADDINERGLDLLGPVHNVLDLTPPQRRGDWYADQLRDQGKCRSSLMCVEKSINLLFSRFGRRLPRLKIVGEI